MTAYKRNWEQKHKGDSDAFYPHDEKLLNTWEKLFHNCLHSSSSILMGVLRYKIYINPV